METAVAGAASGYLDTASPVRPTIGFNMVNCVMCDLYVRCRYIQTEIVSRRACIRHFKPIKRNIASSEVNDCTVPSHGVLNLAGSPSSTGDGYVVPCGSGFHKLRRRISVIISAWRNLHCVTRRGNAEGMIGRGARAGLAARVGVVARGGDVERVSRVATARYRRHNGQRKWRGNCCSGPILHGDVISARSGVRWSSRQST